MTLSEFKIGEEFMMSGRRWRCTDIGTRVVVAIRVDETTISGVRDGKPIPNRVLNKAEAEARGCFNGPPYAVLESVLDEYDLEACEPVT